MKRILLIGLVIGLCFSCQKQNELTPEKVSQIQAELQTIFEVDQAFAGIPPQELRDQWGHEKAWDIFMAQRDSVSIKHQAQIKEWYNTYGYLGFDQVGEEASSNFWIVIQHADNDLPFQQKMLEVMGEELKKNNVRPSEYALLEDRVNVALEKKQRFGTQVTYNDKGQAIPKNGLVDSLNIEALRAEYELQSFKEYYNQMTEAHFFMNKEYLAEKGITEPQLYE